MSCASKSGPKSDLPFWLVYSAFSDLCYRILNMPEPIDLVHFEVCSSEPMIEASYVGCSVFYNIIAWTFQLKEALISTTWDVLDNSNSPCSFSPRTKFSGKSIGFLFILTVFINVPFGVLFVLFMLSAWIYV